MAVKFWIFCGKRVMTFSCSILTMPEVLRDREPQQAEELEHALRLLKEGSGAARRARARNSLTGLAIAAQWTSISKRSRNPTSVWVFVAVVNMFMTARTQSDQVVLGIIPKMASECNVVDL